MFSLSTALITFLIIQHLSGTVFSIYVHRGMGHHLFEFRPVLAQIFKFWLWFAKGFAWPNWQQHYAAKHRKHHMYSDTEQDPHSPYYYSLRQLFDVGQKTSKTVNYISAEEIKSYAPDIVSTNDWFDQNVYRKYPNAGKAILGIILTILFGIPGLIFGVLNYFFIGKLFIFIGNYAFHKIGFNYASKNTTDKSKILFPITFLFGGEELHAHHHNDPSSPCLSKYWWEFDIGWMYCKILIALGLMKLTNQHE